MARQGTLVDALKLPEMVAHARKLRKLLARERKAKGNLANIVADIGDALVRAQEDLKRAGKWGAWGRWLKTLRQDFTPRTAYNYMAVAKLRRDFGKRFHQLSHMDPSKLYRIAALPHKIFQRLRPSNVLYVPLTRKRKRVRDMSALELDSALDRLEGRGVPKRTADSLAKRLDAIATEVEQVAPVARQRAPNAWAQFWKRMDAVRRGLRLVRGARQARG